MRLPRAGVSSIADRNKMATFANSVPEPDATSQEKSQLGWPAMAWFAALLIACYAPLLAGLVRQWATDEDMGHGFFVPLIAGFIAWRQRGELASAKLVPNNWGLALAAWGAVQMLLGTLAAQIFIARTAFLVSVVGAVLFLGGTRALKILAFPLFLLIFLFPIPAIIYARITLPLQIFASTIAETILNLLGIPVLRDGNVLELASQRLSVVEACSGIRSLLSLAFLALIYAYAFDRKIWMRWLLVAATVPIAIAANATRVTLTGVLSEYRTDLAQGFLHLLEGWVLFMVALLLLVVFHLVVNRIYSATQHSNTGTSNQDAAI
jgi:exosortase